MNLKGVCFYWEWEMKWPWQLQLIKLCIKVQLLSLWGSNCKLNMERLTSSKPLNNSRTKRLSFQTRWTMSKRKSIHSKIGVKKENQLSKRRETMKWNSSPSKKNTLPNSMLSSKKKLISESLQWGIYDNYNHISYIFPLFSNLNIIYKTFKIHH